MINFIKAGFITSFCFMLLGCANASYHVEQLDTPSLPYTIPNVPFYPQQEFYCGPTTLAEVANFYGLSLNPEQIAPKTFIPNREGSLQLEMVAATRQLGLIAYADQGDLSLLIDLVNQNMPIIVLQNNGVSWLPQWHYSVVIGFDLPNEKIILHTGLSKELRVNVGVFMNTWQRSNRWFLAMLPPDKQVPELDRFKYVKSAQELLLTNQVEAGTQALQTAIKVWPTDWLAYFLLGNHYFSSDSKVSLSWYQKGINSSPTAAKEVNFLNNYAYALAENNCRKRSLEIINKAILLAPNNSNLLQSYQELQSYPDNLNCILD